MRVMSVPRCSYLAFNVALHFAALDRQAADSVEDAELAITDV
jgi:hypothetical protein